MNNEEDLEERILNLELKINYIIELLEDNNKKNVINNDIILEMRNDILEIKKESKKMSNHINFVEEVYDSVKSPLNYVCERVNNINLLK